MSARKQTLFDREIILPALLEAAKKMNPLYMLKNPVMFVTEAGALIVTAGLVFRQQSESLGFGLQIALWLWFTVYFANFAEAMAEGRGRAQANALRKTRTRTMANRIRPDDSTEQVSAEQLRKGDFFHVSAGEVIPADGEITEGVATVDESAITGESAPVIREAGGDRSAVTGGTRVLSDWIKVRVTANPGESFLDRMIGLVEGARRQKTPNEIALTILLAALTIIFLVVIMTLKFFGLYSGLSLSVTVLVALLVCLIPTTIGGLLSRHRDCGHRPDGTEKCPGHERPGRRGGGRCGRAASRQDGDHHPGRSPGHGVPPCAGCHDGGAGRRRAAGIACR